MADVERDDARGAALQQHVGEAAGGGADVERLAAGDVDAEGVERVRELEPAAADVRVVRRGSATSASASTSVPAFVTDLAVDRDLAGQDQRARPLARRRQAAFDDELIEANHSDRLPRWHRSTAFTVDRFNDPLAPMSERASASRQVRAVAKRCARARSRHSAAMRRDASRPKSAG